MLKRHILINCTSDTVLRFLPPYILQRAHVDTAVAALDEIFTEHAAHNGTQAAAYAATQAAGGNNNG
jgi:acetylornithine aminotransferase/acetylornithine/N-succinyldiaminopimelate aminotransferase